MACLRCDKCGGPTNSFGSWDTEITVLCEKCNEKRFDIFKKIVTKN
jgi:hypothetical protein